VDFYPTLAEIAGAPLPAGQVMDGRSFLPVLRGAATTHRDTIFNFFPHNIAATGQLPAASVRRGDWKLIRYFHDGPGQRDRFELYHLRDDLGETNNLAAAQPARVKELDALLAGFLKETAAVVPGANPDYDPQAAAKPRPPAKAAGKDDSDPRLQGWKARNCEASVKNGVVTITAKGDPPFLGVGSGADGPAVVTVRARCADGGPGKVEWLPSGTTASPTNTAPFTLSSGDWQTVRVEISAPGPLGILRVYLPAQQQPVEVDWIELKGANRQRRWEF
jgi:hypothetical protein